MRNTVLPPGAAPIPLTCGVKKRAATLDMTTNADRPWKFGMLPRMAYPGIFELSHSIGKGDRRVAQHAEVVSPVRVLPDVLAVHHEVLVRRPARGRRGTRCASREPAARWLRTGVLVAMMALITGSLHPMLDSTRFSLNGVSRVRA